MGLFFKDTSKPAPIAKTPAAPSLPTGPFGIQAAPTPLWQPGTKPTGASADGVQRFTDQLQAAIESAKLPGNSDYFALKTAMDKLANVPGMTEDMKLQATLAVMNDVQGIVDSIDHYIEVLNGEQEKFQQALAGKQTSDIDGIKTQIESITQANADRQAKISDLQKEIADGNQQQITLQQQMGEATMLINQSQQEFSQAFSTEVNTLNADKAKIQRFLTTIPKGKK